MGWLRRVNKEDVLNWKDEDGNTALHTAASCGQTEMVKLLVKNVNVNVKNCNDLTAMDIFHLKGSLQNIAIGKILHKAKEKKALDLTSNMTLGDYFSMELTPFDVRDKYLGINTQKNSNKIHYVILVVAILIATATYQAELSPHGGYWQDDYFPPPANNATSSNTSTNGTGLGQGQKEHHAGQMIMSSSYLIYLFIINGLAFHLSMFTILVITIGLPFSRLLSPSIFFHLFAYYASVLATFPEVGSVGLINGRTLYLAITYIFTQAIYYIPLRVFSKHQKLKCRVDNMRGSSSIATPGN